MKTILPAMRHLKPLLTVVLCLIVLATSVTQAIARGQMAGGQMMQLCAGGKAVTVMMDAQGNPADPASPCPDCAAITAALSPAAPDVIRASGHAVRLPPPVVISVVLQMARSADARGPPALI